MPTSPPSVVVPPCALAPPVPAAPVTLPVADAPSMMPALKPASPPPVPFEPPLTLPWAKESEISPKFCPTRPPAEVYWQELLPAQFGPFWTTLAVEVTAPLACEEVMLEPDVLTPTKPPTDALIPLLLTLPVANDDAIDPVPRVKTPFCPTSPPTMLNAPPLTSPLADDPVMVPRLVPTSPPAMFMAVVELASPTLTVAAELEFSTRLLFCPTSPPAMTPVSDPPLTVPLSTWTLLIVPLFSPATTPRIVGLPVPVMVTLARLRLRTVAPASTNGNSATGEPDDERFRLLMM